MQNPTQLNRRTKSRPPSTIETRHPYLLDVHCWNYTPVRIRIATIEEAIANPRPFNRNDSANCSNTDTAPSPPLSPTSPFLEAWPSCLGSSSTQSSVDFGLPASIHVIEKALPPLGRVEMATSDSKSAGDKCPTECNPLKSSLTTSVTVPAERKSIEIPRVLDSEAQISPLEHLEIRVDRLNCSASKEQKPKKVKCRQVDRGTQTVESYTKHTPSPSPRISSKAARQLEDHGKLPGSTGADNESSGDVDWSTPKRRTSRRSKFAACRKGLKHYLGWTARSWKGKVQWALGGCNWVK